MINRQFVLGPTVTTGSRRRHLGPFIVVEGPHRHRPRLETLKQFGSDHVVDCLVGRGAILKRRMGTSKVGIRPRDVVSNNVNIRWFTRLVHGDYSNERVAV